MLSKGEKEIQRFTEEEIKEVKEYVKECLSKKDWNDKAFYIAMNAYTLVKHIENMEMDKQKLIEKLKEDKKKWQEFHNRVPEVPEYIDYILEILKG